MKAFSFFSPAVFRFQISDLKPEQKLFGSHLHHLINKLARPWFHPGSTSKTSFGGSCHECLVSIYFFQLNGQHFASATDKKPDMSFSLSFDIIRRFFLNCRIKGYDHFFAISLARWIPALRRTDAS